MMFYYLYAEEERLNIISQADSSKQTVLLQSIAWEERDHLEQWLDHLSPRDQIVLIVDYIDETLHREWVPKIHFWEKASIEKRFLDKTSFEGALFSHVRWLKATQKTEQGREEQALMIASLYRHESLAFLLDALETRQTSLRAIYSYAFLAEQYFFRVIAAKHKIKRKALNAPFMLLIRESSHSFRQMFVENGSLRISRHLELPPELVSETEILSALMREMDVAIQYLYNQRTLVPNAEVGLVYVSPEFNDGDQVRELFMGQIARDAWDLSSIPVLSLPIGSFKKADVSIGDHCPGLLPWLIQFIEQHHPVSFYKTPYQARVQKLQTTRIALLAASILLGALGSMILIEKAIDTSLLKEKTLAIQDKQNAMQTRLTALKAYSYPDVNAADMQASVQFTQAVTQLKGNSALDIDLSAIAQVVSRHSHIQLDDIHWQKNGGLDSRFVQVKIGGWVGPFNGQYQQPVKWVDEFLTELKKQPKVKEATLTKEPLNRKLENAVSVNSSQSPVTNGLPFQITFVMEGR